ncbi:glycosyltransferase family 2 protein [Frigidibacter sp.]|uniref:glycosyltransferase family 2 protein n=1 Tax=Frigidibacter sp. TaxID=2586418 RepID=UPI002734CF60|nr:glycosyltransferase family 2 protein [Frigidibacter sp.]MDP3339533.1 glycosyltransferase family 2 protein [Frigidibacter sp.]
MPQTPQLRLISSPPAAPQPARLVRTRAARKPLGQILLEAGAVDPGDLLRAVAMRDRQDLPLGDILQAHGWVAEADLMAALATQWDAEALDLIGQRPDPRLVDRLGAETCLRQAVLPWRRAGGATVIATARPDAFQALLPQLTAEFGPCAMALAPERDIHSALLASRQTRLVRKAEAQVPAELSCRGADAARSARVALALLVLLAAGLLLAPVLVLGTLLAWTLVTLLLAQGLKLAALLVMLRPHAPPSHSAERAPDGVLALPARHGRPDRLPMVSIMVPMFREHDIAPRLVQRLGRLDYPKELLDILLVIEEEDMVTRTALSAADLPHWMRTVVVPQGPIKTKPRALNFALNFCRGSIIGVYDAEDAPDADQIHKVVRRFAEAPEDVVCLQGILDFYNPRTNWLSRCFTVEYASWFRVVLPGIARMGLVVPLGGTTLFFRRGPLEELGGWDAHNVTEDADLGLRLARRGYRTELIHTVTGEEANCRALHWVKQRSRWQKGYAMTWGVHMRNPARLWRELGAWRMFGFQVMFLGSLTQSLLAPLLWTFWVLALGLPHAFAAALPGWMLPAMTALFLGSEAVNILCGLWAVRGPRHRHLMPWVPTLHLYHPLGTLSAWKALHEVVTKPFYWDKTQHGLFDGSHEEAEDEEVLVAPPPFAVPMPLPMPMPIPVPAASPQHPAPR